MLGSSTTTGLRRMDMSKRKTCTCSKEQENETWAIKARLISEPPFWIIEGVNGWGHHTDVIIPLAKFCPWCGGALRLDKGDEHERDI